MKRMGFRVKKGKTEERERGGQGKENEWKIKGRKIKGRKMKGSGGGRCVFACRGHEGEEIKTVCKLYRECWKCLEC